MDKLYSDMTQAERTADRISKNRDIERKVRIQKLPWRLDEIANQLNTRKQRATYGAVAKLVGVLPRGLMGGRAKSPEYSWIVAASGPRRGWPTDYHESQIDPECLRQIRRDADRFINDAKTLNDWLES